jgi:hypothetical protein
LRFASDGSASPVIGFNASDWLSDTNSGVALTHFGEIYAMGLGSVFYTDNRAGSEPSLYQTTISLAALGLHAKPIASLTFTMAAGDDTNSVTVTGVFALSGAQFPFIVSSPSNSTVLAGGNATFTVTAGGSPPLQYQWLMNGVLLADNSQITGAQSNVLSLGNVLAADAGNYEVIVASGSGIITSKVATLSVASPCYFQTLSVKNQSFACSWAAVAGWQYQIQFITNLNSTNWINWAWPITATNSVMTATYSATNSQCFYRLLVQPAGD